ncbi:MAG: response regulator [Candidatus Tectomicrobia bacterium]|nr:response regulator [Candidatus Tectomicrobia bacterium]
MNIISKENLLFRYIMISFSVFAVFMLIVTIGFSYLTKRDLIFQYEKLAINAAQHLTKHLSQQFSKPTLEVLMSSPLSPDSEHFAVVDRLTRREIYSLDVVKVKMFNRDQVVVYSTDPAVIGKVDQNNRKLLEALRATPSSKLETDKEVWDLEGEQHFGMDIIETYVPMWEGGVVGGQDKVIGVFEIYQNAQALYADQWESTWRIVIATFLTLLALLSVQLFIVQGAEKVIKNLITAERLLTRQLLQAQKLESLGTLTAGIAHDFNNLLAGIIGYAELISIGLDSQSKEAQHVQYVIQTGQRAASLVRQLLTFSRQTSFELQPFEITPLIKETVKLLERTFPKTVAIQLQLDPGVGNILADPTQIQQVLMNLATNALDAMPDEGTLTITAQPVTLREPPGASLSPGRYLSLSVQDTGTGMPPEILDRIFEPFFTTKAPGKGTGLGLSVVYGIVQNHKGHIQVESALGKGTTFTIYFPLLEQTRSQSVQSSQEAPGGTETLLAVEDDSFVRELTEAMLKSLGYQVLTASDGKEALEIYKKHQGEIAGVVTDLVMPNGGGIGLIKALRQENSHVKVLVMTGYEFSQMREALQTLGVRQILSKPLRRVQLAEQIRHLLEECVKVCP